MFLRLCLAALSLGAAPSWAVAQAPYFRPDRPARYEPARPTLSPYLNYFRGNTGLLNPYNTYIRPAENLGYDLQRQRADLARLQGHIRQVQGAVQQVENELLRPTGAGATFMNYSHYYQFNRQP
jgi:hypothetical protein